MCGAIRIAHPQIASDAKKFFFASDAKTHSLDLNHRKMPEKPSAKILRCWPAMRKIGVFLKIERCDMPAIRTPLRFGLRCGRPRCHIASDVGQAMRATKICSFQDVWNYQGESSTRSLKAPLKVPPKGPLNPSLKAPLKEPLKAPLQVSLKAPLEVPPPPNRAPILCPRRGPSGHPSSWRSPEWGLRSS